VNARNTAGKSNFDIPGKRINVLPERRQKEQFRSEAGQTNQAYNVEVDGDDLNHQDILLCKHCTKIISGCDSFIYRREY
jgi:RNase P/RNase MRP subunit p29